MKAKARESCSNCRRFQALLDAQEARLKALEATVARLRAQLAAARKDSSTSSKPPSSDIVKPPKPPPPEGQDKRRIGKIYEQKEWRALVRAKSGDWYAVANAPSEASAVEAALTSCAQSDRDCHLYAIGNFRVADE